jgi:beta-galactosidase
VLARFVGADFDGGPALTVRRVGPGSARYLATSLADEGLSDVLAELVAEAGITPVVEREPGLRRSLPATSW